MCKFFIRYNYVCSIVLTNNIMSYHIRFISNLRQTFPKKYAFTMSAKGRGSKTKKRENRRFSSTQVLNHNSTKNQKTAPEFKQNPKTKRLFPKKNKKKEEKSLSIFQIWNWEKVQILQHQGPITVFLKSSLRNWNLYLQRSCDNQAL